MTIKLQQLSNLELVNKINEYLDDIRKLGRIESTRGLKDEFGDAIEATELEAILEKDSFLTEEGGEKTNQLANEFDKSKINLNEFAAIKAAFQLNSQVIDACQVLQENLDKIVELKLLAHQDYEDKLASYGKDLKQAINQLTIYEKE